MSDPALADREGSPGSSLAERLAGVRDRIARAARRAGRDPGEVTLVAVSKTRTVEEIREAFQAGQGIFGENRVQEAEDKAAAGLPAGSSLHLVGTLQSNKVAPAVRLFAAIHSVDSRRLLDRIDRLAERPIDVLLQVMLADEPSKHGMAPSAIEGCLAPPTTRARVVGLMLLPPFASDPGASRGLFRRLREIRDAVGGAARLPHLSMGMSHDFEVAVEEGATLVRIGEAIFGPRARRGPA